MKESRFGLSAMILWCITSAGANVYIGAVIGGIDTFLLCFGIFFCSLLFFLVWHFKHLKSLYHKTIAHLKPVLFMNVTTFIVWYLSIYPLKFIEPSISVAIILATVPIGILISEIFLGHKKKNNIPNIILSILLFIGILFLAVVVVDRKSAIQHFPLTATIMAFIGCMVAGFTLAINTIYNKELSNDGFSPFDILVVRFFLLALLMGILSKPQWPTIMHHHVGLHIIIAAFTLIIIPQTIFQYALRELEPITASIVSPLKPVIVFGLEFLNRELILTAWTIIGILYLTIVSVVGTLVQYKRLRFKDTK